MKIYTLITLKRKLEEVLMRPIVWWGRRWARKHPLAEQYDLFFFFPIYGLGGAEKVHADVVACFPEKKKVLFFTRTSRSKAMLHLFTKGGAAYHDISKHTDNKLRYWDNFFYRGVCAQYINSQDIAPVVINGQCNFAYKLLPHLKPQIHTVEIIHNAEKKFAWITFPYVPFIKQRVMVTDVHIKDHGRYYDELGIDASLKTRMVKVLNKTEIKVDAGPRKEYGAKIKFYYAGRGGYQKRVWLLMAALRQCVALNLPAEFHLAGDFLSELPSDYKQFCTYHGEIGGGEAMARFHDEMDVLMLTSAFEGFPMVIMEAMAHGVVPIATAVDGVPENIFHLQNGLLIENKDEASVVAQLVQHIQFLCADRDILQQLSTNAFAYAKAHFSEERFCASYRNLILQEKNPSRFTT
jgi:glycosyltransferase involved in cell wall biosynthesis